MGKSTSRTEAVAAAAFALAGGSDPRLSVLLLLLRLLQVRVADVRAGLGEEGIANGRCRGQEGGKVRVAKFVFFKKKK